MLHHRWPRATVFAALLSVACAAIASAQPQQSTGTGWEIEGYGGLASGRRAGRGTVELPEPGAPLASTSPIFPVRRTPSWFFGDGALMLNQALDELGVRERVAPFDDALSGLGGRSTNGAGFGVRVRRRLSARLAAELGLDVMTGSATVPDELVASAEATSTTFAQAMTGLFASGPFTNTEVTARSDTSGGSTREVALTGAINVALASGGALVPYLTAGGGLITGASDGQRLTIEGRYRTTIDLAGVPIDETDRVTLSYGHGRTYVAVAGAGVRRDLASGWGLRIDGRVLLGRDNTRLRIDASPTVATGSPPGVIETFTHPSLQFSNNPSTSRESSLSGALDRFEAFRGDGLSTRILITVSIVRRF